MQTFSVSKIVKSILPPVLFSAAAAGGLFAVHFASQTADTAVPAARRAAQDAFAMPAPLGQNMRELAAAARKGDVAARLDIAKRYAHGQGVTKNEALAFTYFRTIAGQYEEADPRDRSARHVSEAFRYLANYYRKGVSEADVKADPTYAVSLLHYASSYFGDPIAQVELAKLMLRGEGVPRNPKVAAQWLLNASRKGYAPAQALLGNLLWRGEGVTRIAGDGLGLLAVARWKAAPEDRGWVVKMYEKARAEATPSEVLEANAFIALELKTLKSELANEVLVKGDEPVTSAVGPRGSRSENSATSEVAGRILSRARFHSQSIANRVDPGPRKADTATVMTANAADGKATIPVVNRQDDPQLPLTK